MKKGSVIARWIFSVIMLLCVFGCGFHFSALFCLVAGLLIMPIKPIQELLKKFKIKNWLAILLSVVLLFTGVLMSPTSDTPDINTGDDTSISTTVDDETSSTTDSSKDTTDNSETTSGTESTDKPSTDTSNPTDTSKPTETDKPTTSSGVGKGKASPVSLSSIPAYSGKAYVSVDGNVPNFSAAELTTKGYEKYSNLDSLGRTGVAVASVGKDTMPADGEKRGDISSIKPTGWVQAKYDCVSGGWLYNRCHLIGWQLSAENANKKNLLTGTKYLNISGMLPFENMVADYIDETGNHVAYRITPIYSGNNLLASGVQMEAYSVEDNGEGISFNVYCYNVQPEVTIDYATGKSSGPSSSTTQTPTTSTTPTPEPEPDTNTNTSQTVYITATGKKYHSTKNCSGLSNANAIYDSTLEEAENKGLEPCKKCH